MLLHEISSLKVRAKRNLEGEKLRLNATLFFQTQQRRTSMPEKNEDSTEENEQ